MNKVVTNKIRIVYFGSAEFSIPTILALQSGSYEIAGIVTQPDKPTGRGKKISQNPVKQWSVDNNYPTLQPNSLKDESFLLSIANLKPDCMIVVAYGKILPKQLLHLPKFGVLNVHGSILPRYRGASPVQAAILAGDNTTGVSIMQMDEGMDTGAILANKVIEILPTDTAGSLSNRLAEIGSELLLEVLPQYISGQIKSIPQPTDGISICKKIAKEDARIDWTNNAQKINQQIRAFQPWPVAWTILKSNNAPLKIHEATILSEKIMAHTPGDVIILTNNKLAICCGNDSALELVSVQPQNKNRMKAWDFINGHKEALRSGLA